MTIGYRISETDDNADITAIARRMRADIKRAQHEGLLPAGKISVRCARFAGGQSIDITATIPNAWRPCDGQVYATWEDGQLAPCTWCRDECGPHRSLTEDAAVALMTLERIHSAYNFNNSDTSTDHFDVRYYGGVSIR